jgi:hypothetical protein
MSEATNYMSLCYKDTDYQRVSTFFGPLCIYIYIYIYTLRYSLGICGRNLSIEIAASAK